MSDTWVPSPPQPPGAPPPDTLPPANAWSPTTPCAAADSPSIVPSIVITGVPAIIASAAAGKYVWSITLNDGAPSPNFSIDHYDGNGVLSEHPIEISGTNGDVTLTHDPTQSLGAATKRYVDNLPPGEAPIDSTVYGRQNGTWLRLPPIIPDAPNTSQRYGRFNSIWQLDAIQTDAPSDGGTYGRMNGAWNAALAITGGTITGSLTVNQVLTVQGSNSLVLNAPVTGGNQRSILGMAANVARWQLTLGDGTTEGLNNTGANFSLAAYSTTGAFLGNWLTIARADGSTVFAGPVTMNYGLGVNGLLALQGPSSLYLPGGSPGQVLSTNGSAALSWANPGVAEAPNDGQYYARQNQAWAVAPGGMTDAPNDGTAYARKSLGWAHLTHTDITDWTATLAPYALTSAVPVASSTTPLMDGTAAIGTGTTWARADHVHPSDTSRYAASNPSGYQTAAQVSAVVPVASATAPLMNGTAAAGSSAAWSRGDHVHPVDTSRYAASNPSGFQTAAQVTASLGAYLPLTGGTVTGALTVNTSITAGSAIFPSAGLTQYYLGNDGGGNPVLAWASNWYDTWLNSTASRQWMIYPGSAVVGMALDGNGNLTISGGTATKPGGGAWVAPSDERIKTVEGEWTAGLDAIVALNPVSYRYKGNDTPTADKTHANAQGERETEPAAAPYPASPHFIPAKDATQFIGLIAQEVEAVLPELVKRKPGFIDGVEVSDIRELDTGPLIFALINAVKTLTARVAELEAARG
jgi:hypothetical protein